MSDPRTVLYVVGSRDAGGVGRAGLHSAETLASAGWIQPLVCGPAGGLLELAATAGLPVAKLAPAPALRHRNASIERAVGDADLVHALGLEAARLVQSVGVPESVPLVVTVDDVDERRRLRRLFGSPFSTLRRRNALRWLVPGCTATFRLLHSGLVRGDQVVTLPLLPFAEQLHREWTVARAAARLQLGVAPGTHVVVGVGPSHAAAMRRVGSTIVRRAGEIVGVWIDTGQRARPRVGRSGGLIVVTASEGRQLLPAMDVLLADGSLLVARHAAVDARWAGVPIVTTPTDAAAEMVRHSINGYVCTVSEIASALDAAVDMAVARTLPHRSVERRHSDEPRDTAAVTARCYSAILGHPLLRPVLIGRRAAR